MCVQVQQSTGLKYTSLRLCDVMGPYDNIGVLLRLKAFISTQRPIPAGIKKGSLINPPLSEHRVSIVFSGDVVRCILATIRSGKKAFGQELNVAGAEQRTVREFVALLKEELGVDGEIIWEENVATLFPSVDFGPIDSTKARRCVATTTTNATTPQRSTALRHFTKCLSTLVRCQGVKLLFVTLDCLALTLSQCYIPGVHRQNKNNFSHTSLSTDDASIISGVGCDERRHLFACGCLCVTCLHLHDHPRQSSCIARNVTCTCARVRACGTQEFYPLCRINQNMPVAPKVSCRCVHVRISHSVTCQQAQDRPWHVLCIQGRSHIRVF